MLSYESSIQKLMGVEAQNPNSKTVEVYDRAIKEYLKKTPLTYNETHIPLLRWINKSLSLISPHGKIFEIGTGPGRDALYIESRGYDVSRSDASKAFVSYLRRNGKQATLYNVLEDNIYSDYHMIFANAVIPHLTSYDLKYVLHKIHRGIPRDAIFAFSAKQGRGEAWINEKLTEPRFVRYWEPETLCRMAEDAGFEIAYKDQDVLGDLPNHRWILLTLRKS